MGTVRVFRVMGVVLSFFSGQSQTQTQRSTVESTVAPRTTTLVAPKTQVAAPVLLRIEEIKARAITVEWAAPENGLKLSIKEKLKQGSSTWTTESEHFVITYDGLEQSKPLELSALFFPRSEPDKYHCAESSPVLVILDLEKPFQSIPSKHQVTRSLDLFKRERLAKVLLFGEKGSGKSSLYNAILTFFKSDDDTRVERNQVANRGNETITKRFACIEIPGTNVTIWDSPGWDEESVPRVVVDDYNPGFLEKLLNGHYQPGFILIPPFEARECYTENPSPDDKFNAIVLTFSCEHIGYRPLEHQHRVVCAKAAEANLLKMYEKLRRCKDVKEHRTRIFLALTKADKLLCTLPKLSEGDSQIEHINATSDDVRQIFQKRVARDVRDYFHRKDFPIDQIVFTCGYRDESTRRPDIDALNCDAFNAILDSCRY
eukprot:c10096_g1_i1.p1 GENE.c10096_g1_i1~~c10096_g1_i1.p1  ORF type:complete len:430 (-),score=61.86 c10096_g1_i1:1232-2521(-)